jgi:hypothetical protein
MENVSTTPNCAVVFFGKVPKGRREPQKNSSIHLNLATLFVGKRCNASTKNLRAMTRMTG